ncbi:MAG: hypothetical protein AAGH83_02025 [Pseudomonadota bacterium]
MEPTTDVTPNETPAAPVDAPIISVVLPGLKGGATLNEALRFWDSQHDADKTEILILCPDADEMTPAPNSRARYIDCKGLLLHEARAKGVRESLGQYVLLGEDHSVPQQGTMTSLLKHIEDGWDVVGPAMSPGTRSTIAGQAAFLLGYGEWMNPIEAGPKKALPGHNTLIRREILMERDATLEDDLLMCTFLVRDLIRTKKTTLDTNWQHTHYDPADVMPEVKIYWHIGQGFGAARTKNWPLVGKILYPLAVPVAIGRHWLRALLQYVRAGRGAEMPLSVIPMMTLFAASSGAGEALGALRGIDKVKTTVWKCEIKPVTPEMVQRG